MQWKKLGQVLELTVHGNGSWMVEQAQNPFVVNHEDFVRVYFNTRGLRDADGKSISGAGFVDLDKQDLFKIIRVSDQKIVETGGMGDFDQFGVMAGLVHPFRGNHYLYYVGWTRMQAVPYNWAIGLAISENGGETFKKIGPGPVIGATYNEPYLQAGCSCIVEKDGLLNLFYTSGVKWIETSGKPESMYQIMKATSEDGIHWKRNGIPIIGSVIEDEAQASPTIVFENGKWHMLFSYRHTVDFRNKERGYRIGYAWSDDFENWHRDDEKVNFSVSESGWDSEMVCYPHLARINGKIYLFYCGNDFGKYGFGIAELTSID